MVAGGDLGVDPALDFGVARALNPGVNFEPDLACALSHLVAFAHAFKLDLRTS
ncbi:hypothetical protein FRC10_006100, partial [Ceratobasidium sp. 414]